MEELGRESGTENFELYGLCDVGCQMKLVSWINCVVTHMCWRWFSTGRFP